MSSSTDAPTLAVAMARLVGESFVQDGAAGQLRVLPGTTAELSECVRLASRAGVELRTVGTGSRGGGVPGLRPTVFVDLARMNHVLGLDEHSLVVRVQAGITGVRLEELLYPRRLTLGDYSPAVLRSSLGGLLAVRTGGKVCCTHGRLEDAVLGLTAVLADGRIISTRVAPRRATGPDLAHVLMGSEGTLGVLTEFALRIHRRGEVRLLDAHRFTTMEDAIAASFTALGRDARPSFLRLYDSSTASAIAPGAAETGQVVLALATTGPAELAAVDRDLLAAEARRRGAVHLGPVAAEAYFRHRVRASGVAEPTSPSLQLYARPRHLAPTYAAVVREAAQAKLYAAGYLARVAEDGACWFFTLADAQGRIADEHAHRAAIDAARAVGGIPVGARAPALDPYLQSLRTILDPQNLLNPALFVID